MNTDILGAIDVHAHFSRRGSGPDTPSRDRSLDWLVKMNEAANVTASFCTTYEVAEAGQSADDANAETLAVAEAQKNIFAWIVVDPRSKDSFDRAAALLSHPKAVGLKAVPLGHGYDLADYADDLCDFAASQNAVLQVQVEGDASFVGDIALRHKNATILLGANHRKGYYEALEKAYDNLYLDLAGGAQSANLIVERLVNRFGAEHILYGSEGLTAPGYIRGRVEYARIPASAKTAILRGNALGLFSCLKGADV